MFSDVSLSFREFVMHEPFPVARIQGAIFDFLRGRDDAVMFGAQAVNAYVPEARTTKDVDIMSTRAPELAEEIRKFLSEKFHIAMRVRNVRNGLGYRIYQLQKPENRHLVDVRPVKQFPPAHRLEGVLVPTLEEVIANKVCAYHERKRKTKGISDLLDLARLFEAHPEMKSESGPVAERLRANGADENVIAEWRDLVAREIEPENEEDEFL